jgi:hypothetical protein
MFGEGGYNIQTGRAVVPTEVCNCSDKRFFRLCRQEEWKSGIFRHEGRNGRIKNVVCSDRRCGMFRNEEGMFKNRSVIFLDKKCDLFRQEVQVPT